MENISRIKTKIRDQTVSADILVISRTFLPSSGGIEEYLYNRCLQDPDRIIVLVGGCSGDKAFDKAQKFPVYRWPNLTYYRNGLIGNIIQAILNTVWSFLLAIKLYFRYHYRYIEWGHGYDFISVLLLSYLLPIRFFVYVHGNDILCALRNHIIKSLFELTLKRAKGIVCKSSFTRDYLSTHFRFNTPTHVINPVVRRDKFGATLGQSYLDSLRLQTRSAHDIPQTALVILSVGKFVKRKGFDLIIETLTPLLTWGFDVHYILCGYGPGESELYSLARRLRVERRVHFAGYKPDYELAGYYAACDIFAMLTLDNIQAASIEGLSIGIIEAAYFGKPVITSNVGGIKDVVSHEENGLLVNPYSGNEILQAFRRLCEDSQLRQTLGCRAKALANRRTLYRSLYASDRE
ncbi:glycosyltransferase family 4 protein [Aetokthonos hydrillicola Thurmond2011]|jgi:glycosyltransferase involved in cell wall biosynthesis|uniref:Glycosyltransferase family 4 protein n=1 Tax=Aetokthonos hydrillicola Thurmond2011 TaxID=2712845 RepID=A0AAP5I6G0_9CYAN|nr:glycosyltransferase family 4 protein [Aetokthonos hydrillicola]MBO3461823.1 glycosyltransferase family 4 protein [Aetokthonos hydrillicola CCALA 1050]MBW4589968.1 glycosyltransferase family 4 protein [Aetokthonos hydrillicola CCALA 1050]MDR9895706.1 glycosyltransferase family 4 protein [Aetokthonos hydrillicola Thurmond2011]